jgi:hypothetical protein
MAINDVALQLFEEMKALPCTCSEEARRNYRDECPDCRRWWALHPLLRRALNERMWNFPTISRHAPDRRRSWPADSEEARWLALEAASQARRRNATPPPS